MDADTKRRAIDLLSRKAEDPSVTHSDIALETGYGERQLKSLAKGLREWGAGAVFSHGNSSRRPANAASADEARFLGELKRPYPGVTIAHFRDI